MFSGWRGRENSGVTKGWLVCEVGKCSDSGAEKSKARVVQGLPKGDELEGGGGNLDYFRG